MGGAALEDVIRSHYLEHRLAQQDWPQLERPRRHHEWPAEKIQRHAIVHDDAAPAVEDVQPDQVLAALRHNWQPVHLRVNELEQVLPLGQLCLNLLHHEELPHEPLELRVAKVEGALRHAARRAASTGLAIRQRHVLKRHHFRLDRRCSRAGTLPRVEPACGRLGEDTAVNVLEWFCGNMRACVPTTLSLRCVQEDEANKRRTLAQASLA